MICHPCIYINVASKQAYALQWDLVNNREWADSHCRMMERISFFLRSTEEPIARSYGLDEFKEHFAMRARTQLRLKQDWIGHILVYSDDGFQLDIHEVGEWSSDPDTDRMLSDYRVVTRIAHPRPRVCESTLSPKITLSASKVYLLDLKYWQRWGYKCLRVRHWPGGPRLNTYPFGHVTHHAVASAKQNAAQWLQAGLHAGLIQDRGIMPVVRRHRRIAS
jgi:hypothetical protein